MLNYCNKCISNSISLMHSTKGVICSIYGTNYLYLIKEKITKNKKQKTNIKASDCILKDIDMYKNLIVSTRNKINSVENMLDYIKEESLIDSYIYELKAAKIQHDYLLRKIKEIQTIRKEAA